MREDLVRLGALVHLKEDKKSTFVVLRQKGNARNDKTWVCRRVIIEESTDSKNNEAVLVQKTNLEATFNSAEFEPHPIKLGDLQFYGVLIPGQLELGKHTEHEKTPLSSKN